MHTVEAKRFSMRLKATKCKFQSPIHSALINNFIRAFIHSRLDYCNSVLSGVPDYLLGRLQTVLNSSACLLPQLPGRESVSIRMRNELHWLRFPQRITYKPCLLTFRALQDQAPVYLVRRCVRVSSGAGRARLRSASFGQLVVPRTSKKTFGDRAHLIELSVQLGER